MGIGFSPDAGIRLEFLWRISFLTAEFGHRVGTVEFASDGGRVRVGQLITDRYRLSEQLGSGAHGVVWCAVDEQLDRVVALKHALVSDSSDGGELIGRLEREAKLLAQLNHPNIVTVFDLVRADGQWWLVMEYVPGHSLRELGPLPLRRVATIGVQLAHALAAVHAAGILHRDIKPSNVLVTDDDHAKLGDFGVSRAVYADATLTRTGAFTGTPGYMAPEVAYGADPGPASDVFSLGATLFAAIEGNSPFGDSDNPMVLMRRTAQRDISAPSRAGALTPVLSAMLRTNPDRRPTADQARTRLAEAAAHPSLLTQPRNIRHSKTIMLAVAGVFCAVAVAVWIVLAGSQHATIRKPTTVMGDPRTADPCMLADPTIFDRFGGHVEKDADGGNFNRCDLILTLPGGGKVDTRIELQNPSPQPPSGRVETVGEIGVLRLPAQDNKCERTVLLPDRYEIAVGAVRARAGPMDLCAIADAATATVVDVASRGALPRRTALPPAESLFHTDACALLDSESLSLYPGVEARRPQIGFGNWECRWTSSTTPGSLLVRFDRNDQVNTSNGQPEPLAGHEAYVAPDGYGDSTCQVTVVHRTYTTGNSAEAYELALVVITGPQPPERRCQVATAIATAVAAKLPAH
ncbi:protein kinase [Nocardia arthritidis]|uniref:non-specific serine/threonine protein kinase n=1 Tax=Nocardia arthritidis TaxID=228602 RepID=A0A6G9YM89_9NOCA|nr:protein kinase [Nocardia arthritidis]